MSEELKQSAPPVPSQQKEFRPVKFVHEKGPQFRTYHADGAWCVANALGNINVHFFVEFPKLVDAVVCPVDKSGKFTGEQFLEGAGELDANHYIITRDMQCCLVLPLTAAVAVRDQLNVYIQNFQTQIKSAAEQATVEPKP